MGSILTAGVVVIAAGVWAVGVSFGILAALLSSFEPRRNARRAPAERSHPASLPAEPIAFPAIRAISRQL